MSKEFLGKSKNGCEVYFDPHFSHAVTHFAKHPELKDFVKKAIAETEVSGGIFRFDKDMGEMVGETDMVEIREGDEIVYALRSGRTIYSRFVKNKHSTPTTWITISLLDSGGYNYNLYTAFIGKITPSFPGGDFLPERSREFWSHHALVWGTQEIVPGTETKVCPW